ncbi:MAG: DUF2892 domain-containing protein [Bacteroidota bacterium]
MKKNMGVVDRVLRTGLAIAVGILYFTGEISGVTALVLGIFALVFLVTSAMSFCLLYAPFNISTDRNKAKEGVTS